MMSSLCWTACITVVLLLVNSACTCAELFSSIANLKQLAADQANQAKLLKNYLATERKRLNALENYLNLSSELIEQQGFSVDNPIHAFQLIKVQAVDFKNVVNFFESSRCDANETNIGDYNLLADVDDLKGAVAAILRLQETYGIAAKDFADGSWLGGTHTIQTLSPSDCFTIGKIAHENEDYSHALPWLMVANDTSLQRDEHGSFDKTLLSELLYKSYNLESNQSNETSSSRTDSNGSTGRPENASNTTYVQLCRGRDDLVENKQYCYLKNNRPYLRLAPIKVEKLFDRPEVTLFRQVIYDEEIEQLIRIAAPKLKRANVVAKNRTGYTSPNRVAKNHFVNESAERGLFERLNRRIGYMTELDLQHAESLQVANYGMGGQFALHYDAAEGQDDPLYSRSTGHRLATLLFYLSTPTTGGATVFSKLMLSVPPTKGDALFWYNLRPEGGRDELSQHAGCPVLTGDKWVANKWIREAGQTQCRA